LPYYEGLAYDAYKKINEFTNEVINEIRKEFQVNYRFVVTYNDGSIKIKFS
jgi:hypothetical protein